MPPSKRTENGINHGLRAEIADAAPALRHLAGQRIDLQSAAIA